MSATAERVSLSVTNVRSLIGGTFEDGEGADFEIRNPAHPSKLVARGRGLSEPQVARAIVSAAAASQNWKATPFGDRAAVLYAAADVISEEFEDFATLITSEEGK